MADKISLRKAFWVFVALMVATEIVSRILFVVFPFYLLDRGFTATQLGLVFTLASLALLVFRGFIGRLSDVSGRKWILSAGLLVQAAATALFPFVSRFLEFAVIRSLREVADTLRISVEDALLADVFSGKKLRRKVLAHLGAIFPATRAVAAVVGLVSVTYLSVTYSFWVASLASLSALVIFVLFFNEPGHHGPPHKSLMAGLSLPKSVKFSVQFKKITVVSILHNMSFNLAYVPAFFVLARFVGLSEPDVFQLMLISYILGTIVIGVGQRKIHRADSKLTLMLSLALYTIGVAGYSVVGSYTGILFALLFVSMGFWLFRISFKTILLDAADRKTRGEQIGWSAAVSGFANLIGPAVGGLLIDIVSVQSAFLASAAFSVASLLAATSLAGPLKTTPRKN